MGQNRWRHVMDALSNVTENEAGDWSIVSTKRFPLMNRQPQRLYEKTLILRVWLLIEGWRHDKGAMIHEKPEERSLLGKIASIHA